MKKIKKVLMAVLVVAAAVALVGCKKTGLKYTKSGEYTYLTYSSALGTNWNPHTWETNADDSILSYISTPLVDISVKDSTTGEYQWVYEMATSVTDVTKDHNDDLVKFGATLSDDYIVDKDGSIKEVDMEASEAAGEYVYVPTTIEKGYVYEIKLREGAKWQNGVAINADTYVESMSLLLDPTMHNYRANLYIGGESAVAGGYDRYYSGATGVGDAHLGFESWAATAGHEEDLVWLVDGSSTTVFDEWFQGYVGSYVPGVFADETALLQSGFGAPFTYADVQSLNGKTYKEIAADETLSATFATIMEWWVSAGEDEYLDFFKAPYTFPEVEYEGNVGLYKVDDYTIRYVTETPIDYYYFLTSLTSNWLVYAPLYKELMDNTGELTTTKYNSSKETSMSYGVYKIESLQDGKQIIFTQNENWYGFTEKDGKLYSETEFLVDGKKQEQYKTTRIVIDVMTDAAAKEAFLKGLLDDWAPASDELSSYSSSSQLYQVDETYTMRFFFNTNVEVLQKLDAEANQYSVVLSNAKFRKAFSLAINRSEFVTATSGYKAAYSLLNSLYFYNVYEDPTSIYRNTDQAMKGIVDLYGVEYGEGKTYKTLAEAYNSINGYNLAEAQKLMKEACAELVEAGLYVEGQDITIQIGYTKGAMQTDEQKQVSMMNTYINNAVEGSGFGKITLEGIGNLEDRYGDVPKGKYAIGYGAWGGAAFYPFTTFQVYMDSDKYDLNEAGCWDPAATSLTIKFPEDAKYGDLAGTEDSMSYAKWSNSMDSTGKYANAGFDVKLYITSQLEYNFLSLYYCIPLCATTSCSLLSYKTENYTDNYSIMYGFGGLRLMKYNYDDAEWESFIKKEKKLSYN